jgi:hypothetical protein
MICGSVKGRGRTQLDALRPRRWPAPPDPVDVPDAPRAQTLRTLGPPVTGPIPPAYSSRANRDSQRRGHNADPTTRRVSEAWPDSIAATSRLARQRLDASGCHPAAYAMPAPGWTRASSARASLVAKLRPRAPALCGFSSRSPVAGGTAAAGVEGWSAAPGSATRRRAGAAAARANFPRRVARRWQWRWQAQRDLVAGR